MITSIQQVCFQLFSHMMPSHLNSPLVIVFHAYKTIPLVAQVGRPKFSAQYLTYLHIVELSDVLHIAHALAPLERLIPPQKFKKNKNQGDRGLMPRISLSRNLLVELVSSQGIGLKSDNASSPGFYRLNQQKISLMLRQRQHTVPTSAYSTIIEILQLLQTVVTIGS